MRQAAHGTKRFCPSCTKTIANGSVRQQENHRIGIDATHKCRASQPDFVLARTRAIARDFAALLSGSSNRLLDFNRVSHQLRIGGPIYCGVQLVPVAEIIGSVQRYQDFDRAFLPLQSISFTRWTKVNRAWYKEVSLPPVSLYKVGNAHFAVDG